MKKRVVFILCCLSLCLMLSSCDDMKSLESKGDQSVFEQTEGAFGKETNNDTGSDTTKDRWTNNY